MKQIIMVKNNKGGIGKTFVSINLADYLSKTTVNGKQANVLVLTDDGQNNILAYSEEGSRLNFKEIKDLNYCLENLKLETFEIKPNIEFIPISNSGISQIGKLNLVRWLEVIKKNYDYIIIDSNAGLDNLTFLEKFDYWIAPLELTGLALNSLQDTIETVKQFPDAVVPNKVRDTIDQKMIMETLKEMIESYNSNNKVDIFLAPNIKLSATYENMQFSSKTATELGKRRKLINENGEILLDKNGKEILEEKRKFDFEKIKDLNFAFFKLAEHMLDKMSEDNNIEYKFQEEVILKNKNRIMAFDNMKELSEFTNKYDLNI